MIDIEERSNSACSPTIPSAYPLNQNEWSFPVCEVFHIVSFAIAISTVAMVDLRMLGLAFKSKPASVI